MKNYDAATVEPDNFINSDIGGFSRASFIKEESNKYSSSESLLNLLDSTIKIQRINFTLISSQNMMDEPLSTLCIVDSNKTPKKRKHQVEDFNMHNETPKKGKHKHHTKVFKAVGIDVDDSKEDVLKLTKTKKKPKHSDLSVTESDAKHNHKYSSNFEIVEVCGSKKRKDYFIVQSEEERGTESVTKHKKSKKIGKDSNLSETETTAAKKYKDDDFTVAQNQTNNIVDVSKKSRNKQETETLSPKSSEFVASLFKSTEDKKSKKTLKHSSLSVDVDNGDIQEDNKETKKYKHKKNEDALIVQIDDNEELELIDHKPKKNKEHKDNTQENDNKDIIDAKHCKVKKKKCKKLKDYENLSELKNFDNQKKENSKSFESYSSTTRESQDEHSIKSPELSECDDETEKIKNDQPKKKKKKHKDDTQENDNKDKSDVKHCRVKKKKCEKLKDYENISELKNLDNQKKENSKSFESYSSNKSESQDEHSIKSPELSECDDGTENIKNDTTKKKNRKNSFEGSNIITDENDLTISNKKGNKELKSSENDLSNKIEKLYSGIVSPPQISKTCDNIDLASQEELSMDATDMPKIIKKNKRKSKHGTSTVKDSSLKNHKKLDLSPDRKEMNLSSKIEKLCSAISDSPEVPKQCSSRNSDSDLESHEKNKSKEIKVNKLPSKQSSIDEKEDSSIIKYIVNESFEDMKQLSEEDIQTLLNLHIAVPWTIPLSHRIETRISSHPTKEQQQKFKDLDIKMKTGPYSKDEDNKIKENWQQFCKEHDLQPNPRLFLPQKVSKNNVLHPHERLNFVRYLGKDLQNRSLYSIYNRFCVLFRETKKGRFTPEEDNIILTYAEHTETANRFSVLATVLNRSRECLKKRFDVLLAKEIKIIWDLQLMENCVRNLIEVTNVENIEQLKDFDVEMKHWKQIEEKMGISAVKLRNKWISCLYPQLFIEDCNNLDEIRGRLVDKLYKSNETDRRNISWNEVAQDFPGVTGQRLSRIFSDLLVHYVPAVLRNDFRACVTFLKEVLTNCKRKSKILAKLVYEDDMLQEVKKIRNRPSN